MPSKPVSIVVGIGIVAVSFVVTLFVLDSISNPAVAPETSQDVSRETSLNELLALQSPHLQWLGIAKLNVKAVGSTSVLGGQPILRMIPTSQDGFHTLVAQLTGYSSNQSHHVTAWVKPLEGANVELAVSDQLNHDSGTVVFNLSNQKVMRASDAAKDSGVEQTSDGWQKIWVNLPTSDGEYSIAVRPIMGDIETFKGNGKMGLILGGFEVSKGG